jgi:ferrochelatase
MTGLPPYDAVLLVSFGGPERPDDVMPFLENVTRGRGIPRQRLAQVAAHYLARGGVSPINEENRRLLAAIQAQLEAHGPALPVYWGNRNWHPLLAETLAEMAADGIQRAVAFVTSAFSSYSSCRQYREDLAAARLAVGPGAPTVDKIRPFFNHPGFIEPMAASVAAALDRLPPSLRPSAALAFTAHSIPRSMADSSDYQAQLLEACRLVTAGATPGRAWSLVFQSRSGSPAQPWLEPDIGDHLRHLHDGGVEAVVVAPIGFVSDHMEVVHDLDTEAAALASQLGMTMVRAATVGTSPYFAAMVRELIMERTSPTTTVPRALGTMGPRAGDCAADCCPAPTRPTSPPASASANPRW